MEHGTHGIDVCATLGWLYLTSSQWIDLRELNPVFPLRNMSFLYVSFILKFEEISLGTQKPQFLFFTCLP